MLFVLSSFDLEVSCSERHSGARTVVDNFCLERNAKSDCNEHVPNPKGMLRGVRPHERRAAPCYASHHDARIMIFPVPQNRPGVKTISQNKGDTSMYVSMYLCMFVCINVYTYKYIHTHSTCMYVCPLYTSLLHRRGMEFR